MDNKKLLEEIDILIKEGTNLYYSMFLLDEEGKQKLIDSKINIKCLPSFTQSYNHWYTKSYYLIEQIMPFRLNDFVELYKPQKKKELSFDSYSISDALLGHIITQGLKVIARPISASSKMEQQIAILKSAKSLLEDYFYNLRLELVASLFDSELDSAYELLKKNFLRAAGAIAGVVLEKHLGNITVNHKIAISKKNPTIADYNDKLKEANIIDTPTWRKIQYLGDLRNICCHDKKIEPTDNQAKDLLDGVKYITNNVF